MKDGEDEKADGDEDTHVISAELARIHHQDNLHRDIEESTNAMGDMKLEEQKEKTEEEKRKEMTKRLLRTKD